MKDAKELCLLSKKATLTHEQVRSSVLLNFPVELAQHTIAQGEKSIGSYMTAKLDKGDKRSRSEQSGLIFPCGRIFAMMKAYLAGDGGKSGGCGKRKGGATRVSSSAPVFLAAVLECLTAKLIVLSADSAAEQKRTRIIPRHINLCIRNDDDFAIYLCDTVVAAGGVVPFIHSLLLPLKRNTSKNEEEDRKIMEEGVGAPLW
eukprot:CAMPEP_0201508778 /NCGR_PEP_ID=MMETSP0161_2-20130828/2029_1 /ASSEMBLY_ACC=CAM_ASM_000251 /TAXON_ID=180227 /ORGANISM="Neoparamoeba aestuarina, Strain SoJaBio B1-5/56/2" /LENGTH=201 /DNA_ID=CAMNT_0047903537 /DNA_START=117 /DNA_END=722 /DNA_ORIENTATION=-